MKSKLIAKIAMLTAAALFLVDCQSYQVIQSDSNTAVVKGGRRTTETEAKMVALEGAREHFGGADVTETKEAECEEEMRGKARATSSNTATVRLKTYYQCIVFVKKR